MLKKLIIVVAVLLMIGTPAAWAGAGSGSAGGGGGFAGGNGGFAASASADDSQGNGLAVSTNEQTKNSGETQKLEIRSQVATQAGNGSAEQLRERLRECLQIMQKGQNMSPQDWEQVNSELEQLCEQYQTNTEMKEEIRHAFKTALQMAKEQNYNQENDNQEIELLLRKMIRIEPLDLANYQELGKLYRQRGDKAPRVWCAGNEIKSDVPPVIKDGRTLVPLRAITEALGAEVQWQQTEQTVLISQGDTRIQLQIRNRVALVNGEEVKVDVPPEISNSRVMVPLRLIAQALNASVDYIPEGNIIIVNP